MKRCLPFRAHGSSALGILGDTGWPSKMMISETEMFGRSREAPVFEASGNTPTPNRCQSTRHHAMISILNRTIIFGRILTAVRESNMTKCVSRTGIVWHHYSRPESAISIGSKRVKMFPGRTCLGSNDQWAIWRNELAADRIPETQLQLLFCSTAIVFDRHAATYKALRHSIRVSSNAVVVS